MNAETLDDLHDGSATRDPRHRRPRSQGPRSMGALHCTSEPVCVCFCSPHAEARGVDGGGVRRSRSGAPRSAGSSIDAASNEIFGRSLSRWKRPADDGLAGGLHTAIDADNSGNITFEEMAAAAVVSPCVYVDGARQSERSSWMKDGRGRSGTLLDVHVWPRARRAVAYALLSSGFLMSAPRPVAPGAWAVAPWS